MSVPTIECDGVRLAYEQRGNGPPVVLLHGYPLDHTMWEPQIAALSTSHRVIAPDLRGFGDSTLTSDAAEQGVEMVCYAEDVASLLDALGVREPVVLAGFSMGGYVLWQFVRHFADRVRALILCDTRAAADTDEVREGRLRTVEEVRRSGVETVVEAMLPKLLSERTRQERPELVDEVATMMRRCSPAAVAAALQGMARRPDVRNDLPAIQQPALVLAGAEDAITPPSEMREMADALPHAEFVEIPNAAHLATLENPEAVTRAMQEFVNRLPAG